MIDALWLIVIIPVSVAFGAIIAGLLSGNDDGSP